MYHNAFTTLYGIATRPVVLMQRRNNTWCGAHELTGLGREADFGFYSAGALARTAERRANAAVRGGAATV
jgi:hypothetical protein